MSGYCYRAALWPSLLSTCSISGACDLNAVRADQRRVLRLPLVSWRSTTSAGLRSEKFVRAFLVQMCAGVSEAWLVERAFTTLVGCPIQTRYLRPSPSLVTPRSRWQHQMPRIRGSSFQCSARGNHCSSVSLRFVRGLDTTPLV